MKDWHGIIVLLALMLSLILAAEALPADLRGSYAIGDYTVELGDCLIFSPCLENQVVVTDSTGFDFIRDWQYIEVPCQFSPCQNNIFVYDQDGKFVGEFEVSPATPATIQPVMRSAQ